MCDAMQAGEQEPDVNLPAAWRIDRFLDDYEDEKLDTLAKHKLEFLKVAPKSDAMATNFDDDYKVRVYRPQNAVVKRLLMLHQH